MASKYFQAPDKIFDLGLRGEQVGVLCLIIKYTRMDNSGSCWISQMEIARLMNMTRKTIQRIIDSLIKQNIIYQAEKRHKSKSYFINLKPDSEWIALPVAPKPEGENDQVQLSKICPEESQLGKIYSSEENQLGKIYSSNCVKFTHSDGYNLPTINTIDKYKPINTNKAEPPTLSVVATGGRVSLSSLDESFVALAEQWQAYATEVLPHTKPQLIHETVATLKLMAGYLHCTPEKLGEILSFVRTNDFWRPQAISLKWLMKKRRDGTLPLDSIVGQMSTIKPKSDYRAVAENIWSAIGRYSSTNSEAIRGFIGDHAWQTIIDHYKGWMPMVYSIENEKHKPRYIKLWETLLSQKAAGSTEQSTPSQMSGP